MLRGRYFWKEVGGWSGESKCQTCHQEEGTEKHRLYHCPEGYEVRMEIPEDFRKWGQNAKTSKGRVEVAKIVTNPLTDSQ